GGTDAWDWDGIDWQLRAAVPAPPASTGQVFAYDRVRERAVLFSGGGSGGDADLWELGPVQPARVTPFGVGCTGTLGAAMLDGVGDRRPWLGDAVALRLSPVLDGAVALFALGSSNTQWSGAPLPAPLDGLGMPGCSLLVGIDETFAAVGSGG